MAIKLGSTNFGSLYLGSVKIGEAYLGSVKVYGSTPPDPYNPYHLPEKTFRLKFTEGHTPQVLSGYTCTQVSSSPNIWDITSPVSSYGNITIGLTATSTPYLLECLGANPSAEVTGLGQCFLDCTALTNVCLFDTSNVTDMESMFYNCSSLVSVPLLPTSNVTNMRSMFRFCSALQTVPLFDTSSVLNMRQMFSSCTALTTVPLLNTASVTDVKDMFSGCLAVTSGALAMYNQMSGQSTPPSTHSGCFSNCGYGTTSGQAELAQIPSSWGGTGA